jgi:hypothetical protein
MKERMPHTEMDDITLTRLTPILKRARKQPKLTLTILAHFINVGALKGYYNRGFDTGDLSDASSLF